MNRLEIRFIVVLSLCTLLSGCNEPPQGYFPMQAGLSWEYRVTTERKGSVETERFSIRNLETRKTDSGVELIRRTSDGTDYILRQEDGGIFRIAKRSIVQHESEPDGKPRYVLRFPLRPGNRWVSDTHVYVVQRTLPVVEALRDGTQLELSYQIQSMDETVEVPAGRFERCLLVTGIGSLTIYSDAAQGWTEIPVETREWYAPDTGLIKLERTETLDMAAFSGGIRRFELLRWNG